MALLNQGFVRALSLDDNEDAFSSINNLAGGTITSDMVLFANNKNNTTRLIFKRPLIESNNTVTTDGDGSIFRQDGAVGTFGNGDKVRIKSIIKIVNAERDGGNNLISSNETWAAADQIRITLERNLPAKFFDPNRGPVRITMYDTDFSIATDRFNGIEYVATGLYQTSTAVAINVGIGYPANTTVTASTTVQSGSGNGELVVRFNTNQFGSIDGPLTVINAGLGYQTNDEGFISGGTGVYRIINEEETIGPSQFFINEVGRLPDDDGNGVDQNSIGDFDTSKFAYIVSSRLPAPEVVSGDPLDFNRTYFIANSNATDQFKIGRNFSRRELIDLIDFGSSFAGDVSSINGYDGTSGCSVIFERTNECTQENLRNLSRPVFEDRNDFTYTSGSLQRSIGENFTFLESRLDSAAFYTLKKYLTKQYNYYDEESIDFSGNLYCTDPDGFNQTTTDLASTDKSPGVYIINKDLSTINNLVLTRAYSDNTQPWELNVDTLEYQSLRDFDGNFNAANAAAQEMQIGNLILQDKPIANGGTDAVEIGSATEQLQNVTVLSQGDIDTLGVPASDQAQTVFTHKMNVLIDTGNGPEFYSICLSNTEVLP